MIDFLVALLATLVYGSFIGYWSHWLMHQSWSGPLHVAHMYHHIINYPAGDLISDEYRSSGSSSGWVSFTPFVVVAVGLACYVASLLGASLISYATILVEMAVVGVLHGVVHDRFHLRKNPLLGRWAFFWKARDLHMKHHWNMSKNMGILYFGWDKLFGSYAE
jgi:hypothetical protein